MQFWADIRNTRQLKYTYKLTPNACFLIKLYFIIHKDWGLGWRRWLRHRATSRRVPGSVTGNFFPGHQTVPCALGSTQPLKMSTRIFLGVKMAGDDLTTFMCRVSRNSGTLTLRLLMSYIYGAPILDVSRSHTTTHHSR